MLSLNILLLNVWTLGCDMFMYVLMYALYTHISLHNYEI